MKKILFIASLFAVSIFAMTGCKDKTDYNRQIQDRFDAFLHYYNEVAQNPDMTDDQKELEIADAYEQFGADIEAIATKGLKTHKDDSVAVSLVLAMNEFELTDAEGILGLIDGLGPNARQSEEIVNLRAMYEKKSVTAEGTMFADFSAVQPDGRVAKLSDYAGKGKYCLVDFWASWCGPCRREIPNLKEVYEKYGPKGLEMVSVAVWDKVDDTVKAAAELGITWNQIVNAQKEPTDIYAIEGIPHIMLIGPDGTILKRDLRGKGIQKELEKYF